MEAQSPILDDVFFFNVIHSLVTLVDNDFLVALPSKEEIQKAVFNFEPDSALGPNNFTGKFFHSYWDFISSNVIVVAL